MKNKNKKNYFKDLIEHIRQSVTKKNDTLC